MGQNTILCLLMATLDIAVVRFSGSILIYGDIPGNLFLWFMNPPFWPYIYFEHIVIVFPLLKWTWDEFFKVYYHCSCIVKKCYMLWLRNAILCCFCSDICGKLSSWVCAYLQQRHIYSRNDNSLHCEVMISEFIWWAPLTQGSSDLVFLSLLCIVKKKVCVSIHSFVFGQSQSCNCRCYSFTKAKKGSVQR